MNEAIHLGDFTSKAGSSVPVPCYFGDALAALADERPEIVVLCGDLSPATECDVFRDRFPERFFMAGIAEANMVGVAAGMARCGDVPFVHTFSVFATRRPFDQVAMQLAYPQTNVKLVGFLPGLSTLLGVSHQAIDDIALMRALPNMTIVEPAGPAQYEAAIRAAADHHGPVYLRVYRPDAPVDPAEPAMPLELGQGQILRDGPDAVLFAGGQMIAEALAAADMLADAGVDVTVANIHTVKPLDTAFVVEHARRTGHVVTAENHSIIGGLGSAVAETLMEAGIAAKFARIGIRDTFAEGGSTPYLFEKYGLSAHHLKKAVLRLTGAE